MLFCKDCQHLHRFIDSVNQFDGQPAPECHAAQNVKIDPVYGSKSWEYPTALACRLSPCDDACGKNADWFAPKTSAPKERTDYS